MKTTSAKNRQSRQSKKFPIDRRTLVDAEAIIGENKLDAKTKRHLKTKLLESISDVGKLVEDGKKISWHINNQAKLKRKILKAKNEKQMNEGIKEFITSVNNAQASYFSTISTMRKWSDKAPSAMFKNIDKIQETNSGELAMKEADKILEADVFGLAKKMGFSKSVINDSLSKAKKKKGTSVSIYKQFPAKQVLFDSTCLPTIFSLAPNGISAEEMALVVGGGFWDDAWDFVVEYVAPVVAVIAIAATIVFAGVAFAAALGAEALFATTSALAIEGGVSVLGAVGTAWGASFLTGVAVASTLAAVGSATVATAGILIANQDTQSAKLVGTGQVQASVSANLMSGGSSRSLTFYGNKHTKELHLPQCGFGQGIHTKNLRYWHSISEAIHSGYNGCHFCLSQYDKG